MMQDVSVSVGALAVGAGLLEATVRTATPLAYAALGESVSERAGVINIGLEGSIIAGALSATIAAGAVGVGGGFAAGAAAGLAATSAAWPDSMSVRSSGERRGCSAGRR
mgnify:CR=1 FL=1